jgi:hypothetical protein
LSKRWSITKEVRNLLPTWLPEAAAVVVVETEATAAVAVETEAASCVEDRKEDEVVEAAAGVGSSRAQSASCVARRATMSSSASSISIPSWTEPRQKSAAAATTSYGMDTNWYVDSGATDHLTGELEKLSIRDKYHGGDLVHTTSGSGMRIDHVDHRSLHSPVRKIHLRNILHVPIPLRISFQLIVLFAIMMLF